MPQPVPGARLGSRDAHTISSCQGRDGRRATTSLTRSCGPQLAEQPKDQAWTCEMTGQDSGVCAPLVLVSSEPCILCEDQAWTCGKTRLDTGMCMWDYCASKDGGVNDGGD
jgi:hypothetical protein